MCYITISSCIENCFGDFFSELLVKTIKLDDYKKLQINNTNKVMNKYNK